MRVAGYSRYYTPLHSHPQLPQSGQQIFRRSVALDAVAVPAQQLQVLDVSVPPRLSGTMWSTVKLRNGNPLRHPLHRASCCPNSTCLFWRYGTDASPAASPPSCRGRTASPPCHGSAPPAAPGSWPAARRRSVPYRPRRGRKRPGVLEGGTRRGAPHRTGIVAVGVDGGCKGSK